MNGNFQIQSWPTPLIFSPSESVPSILTDRTYYVAQAGSDLNDGLTAGSAWATIPHAMEVIGSFFVPSNVTVTVQLLAGTIEIGDAVIPPLIDGELIITGNTSDLSAVSVSLDGTSVGFSVTKGQRFTLEGFNISSVAASANAVFVEDGHVRFGNIRFGANFTNILTLRRSGILSFAGSLEFTANFTRFVSLAGQGMVDLANRVFHFPGSVTITEFLNNSSGYVRADGSSRTGTNPTGKQYTVQQNSVLLLSGATLPGTVAGTTATGGQVV